MLYFKKALPSVVTLTGLLLGLAGLLTQNLYLMMGSLGLDIVDGYAARALGTTSAFGAELDWHVDAALAVAALMFFEVPWAIVPLVFLQAVAKVGSKRISGRTVVWVVCAVSQSIGGISVP